MNAVELFVGLKIPDTTAITTLHAIERMGYSISKLRREIYYKFEIEGDKEKFSQKIGKVDILVNANKNKYSTKLNSEEGEIHILVKDTDDKCEGLLHTLQNRLGFKEIKSMQRGIVWTLYTNKAKAEEIAKKLLYNEHYQSCDII